MSETVTETGKTRAIIAHITIIGWLIALIKNTEDDRDQFASFYIRQMLGIVLVGVASSAIIIVVGTGIPFFSGTMSIAVVLLWMYSLAGAAQGKKTTIPVVGDLFQDWFKSL